MKSGIYRIVVRRPEKPDLFYIGQSSQIEKRWKSHLRNLRIGKHENIRLQALFSKYGEASFLFETILACSGEVLTLYEQAIVDFYLSTSGRRVLNICRQCVTSALGTKRTPEQRARLSAAKIGKPGRAWSDEQKAKVSLKNKGKTVSQQQRERHSRAMTGRRASEETCLKMSLSHSAKMHSTETKSKLCAAAKLRGQSLEYRAKLSSALQGNKNCLGRKHSVETKQKLSQAAIRRENRRRVALGLTNYGASTKVLVYTGYMLGSVDHMVTPKY